MTKTEKAELLEELKEKFSQNANFYFMDAAGMSVAEVNKFRKICFEKGIQYQVIKNSLIKKALESLEEDYSPLYDTALKGFSGVLFSEESGSAPAKMIKEFRKRGAKKPVLKGAAIDASFYLGEESLEELTKIKSKQDVIAELIGLLQSPAQSLVRAMQAPSQNLVSALQSGQNNLAGVLKSIETKQS